MDRIAVSVCQTVGNTPLLEPVRLEKARDLRARLLLKLECRNPAGSAKDRIAFALLRDARQRGALMPGGTVIEATSGNTGIALAAAAAAEGYRAVLVMPDSVSVERQRLLRAYGARTVLTPGRLGMAGAVEKARELARELPGSFLPEQFSNPVNAAAYYRTTGPEIWTDSGGQVDVFVAGVGTGGTLTGTGRYLKEKNPRVRVVAVEPADSPLLSGGKTGQHGITGIGAGFVPAVLDTGLYDAVIPVTQEQAYAMCRLLAGTEGILCGISSGAALQAAVMLAEQPENAGCSIVALLPDSGERYLSLPDFPG